MVLLRAAHQHKLLDQPAHGCAPQAPPRQHCLKSTNTTYLCKLGSFLVDLFIRQLLWDAAVCKLSIRVELTVPAWSTGWSVVAKDEVVLQ